MVLMNGKLQQLDKMMSFEYTVEGFSLLFPLYTSFTLTMPITAYPIPQANFMIYHFIILAKFLINSVVFINF